MEHGLDSDENHGNGATIPQNKHRCDVTPASLGFPEQKTKPELPTSPLPSRGPKKKRTCYITPAFSGSPEEGTKSELATSRMASRRPISPSQRVSNVGDYESISPTLKTPKNCGCASAKERYLKKFPQMVCLRQKTPLKPPPLADHFKKKWGSKIHHAIGFPKTSAHLIRSGPQAGRVAI